MKVFNPGAFRHRIQFLKQKRKQDEYGQQTDEWIIYKSTYASKTPLIGKEFYEAQTTESRVEVKFNMRYMPGVTSDMRLRHGSDIYEILAPPQDVNGMNKEMICYCRLVK